MFSSSLRLVFPRKVSLFTRFEVLLISRMPSIILFKCKNETHSSTQLYTHPHPALYHFRISVLRSFLLPSQLTGNQNLTVVFICQRFVCVGKNNVNSLRNTVLQDSKAQCKHSVICVLLVICLKGGAFSRTYFFCLIAIKKNYNGNRTIGMVLFMSLELFKFNRNVTGVIILITKMFIYRKSLMYS